MSVTSVSQNTNIQQMQKASAPAQKFNSYTALRTDEQRGAPLPNDLVELSESAKEFLTRNNRQLSDNEPVFTTMNSRAIEISRKVKEAGGDINKMLGLDAPATYQPNVDFLNSVKEKIEPFDLGGESIFAGLPSDTDRLRNYLSQHPDKAEELMSELREHLPIYEKTPVNGNHADGEMWRNILALRTTAEDVLGRSIYGSRV